MKTRIFLFLLALFCFAGCSSHNAVKVDIHAISFNTVSHAILANQEHIRTLKTQGRISIETGSFSQSASFSLQLKKPDTLLVTLQGPFGIKVGAALLTRNDFFFYNSLQNKLITGKTTGENIRDIFHVQMEFNDLLNLFSGGTFMPEDMREPDTTRIEDDQYVFTYTTGAEKRTYWIDPASYLIRKIQFADTNNEVFFQQQFDDFTIVDGILVPHDIQVAQPIQHKRISLSYSGMELNITPMNFPFTVPQNAEKIYR